MTSQFDLINIDGLIYALLTPTTYAIMGYAQLVIGPAGSGKSTYCSSLYKHCETMRRTIHIVKLRSCC
ncbi:hypothetical protein ACSBR1_033038 [Camellia fascicularis]